MKILVTGASGFIGRALCAELDQRGHLVVPAVRAPRGLPNEVVIGEIGRDSNWGPGFAPGDASSRSDDVVEAVVHLAARVHVMRDTTTDPLSEFRRVNTEGTLALARQAAEAGVRRLVFLSSIKVNGERSTVGCPFTADDVPNPSDPYARSKWEAERGLRELAEETGLEVVVLRPPLVYGAGVRANFLAMLRWIDRGLPLPFARIDNRRSLLFLGNLVDSIRLGLEHEAAAGRTLLPSDGEPVSTVELIRCIGEALGRRARLLPIPVSVLRGGARLIGKSNLMDRLTDSLVVDDGELQRVLGWRPPHTLAAGLAQTCEWYRHRDF